MKQLGLVLLQLVCVSAFAQSPTPPDPASASPAAVQSPLSTSAATPTSAPTGTAPTTLTTPLPTAAAALSTTKDAAPIAAVAAPEKPEPDHEWRILLAVGKTAANTLDQTLKLSNGTALDSSQQKPAQSPHFGIELDYQKLKSPLGVGIIIEANKIKSDTAGVPDDSESALLLTIRGEKRNGPFRFWIAGAAGLETLKFGQTSETSGVVRITMRESSISMFTLSPRAGIDLEVIDGFFVGAEAAYHYYEGTFDADVVNTSSGQSVVITDEFKRGWYHWGLRVGFTF